MTIRLVLADDHPLILRGLEHLFGEVPDCTVLACCTNGEEALAAVRRCKPDVLIVDSKMPVMNGLEVLRVLLRERLPTRVVLHAESGEEEWIGEAVRLGVRGVMLKEMSPATLLECVRKVHAGDYWVERRSALQALDELLRREQGAREVAAVLTPREQEILLLACRGSRNREMAKSLSISESTVKVHVRHIYEKLHVSGRLALLRYAEEKGLIRSIRS